jgi:hypothetical protein
VVEGVHVEAEVELDPGDDGDVVVEDGATAPPVSFDAHAPRPTRVKTTTTNNRLRLMEATVRARPFREPKGRVKL